MTRTGLPGACPDDRSAPYRHRYCVVVIHLTLFWFVHAHTSTRAACSILVSLRLLLALPVVPSHETVRTWLLRLGLFLLRQALAPAWDWVFIIDSTIRLGTSCCLVILGARLGCLARKGAAPGLHDVVVLDVAVSDHCNGEFVAKRLREVITRVGSPPRQIVSDHGSELVKAVRLIQAEHPNVVDTYDVTHKMACLLEAELARDTCWQAFLKGCSACLPRLQQTAGAFLMPPSLRSMARYMNVDTHVEWAQRVLGVLDRQDVCVLARELGGVPRQEALAWLEARLGWLREFREEVGQYAVLMGMLKRVEELVKNKGLSQQTARRVGEELAGIAPAGSRWGDFAGKVGTFVTEQAGRVPVGRTWLGSSDVIESLFGKYKHLGDRAPFPEIGPSVLTLPVLAAQLDGDLIRKALETVSCSDVRDWVRQNVGESTLSMIKKVLLPCETPAVPAAGATQNQHDPQRPAQSLT